MQLPKLAKQTLAKKPRGSIKPRGFLGYRHIDILGTDMILVSPPAIPSVNKEQHAQRCLERTRTCIRRASRFVKKRNGAFWRARALGGRQPAILLRPCPSPFPLAAGAMELFGRKTDAGLADETAGRSPAGEENTAGRLFGITKTVFPFVHRGYDNFFTSFIWLEPPVFCSCRCQTAFF